MSEIAQNVKSCAKVIGDATIGHTKKIVESAQQCQERVKPLKTQVIYQAPKIVLM